MSAEYVNLRKFTPDEIIFDDEQIITILLFFFPGYDSSLNSFVMNHSMREFSQGLLLEAVDSSYAMGYVELVAEMVAGLIKKPTSEKMRKVLKDFAKKAAKHWFKHLEQITDLSKIKIYETVRRQLSDNFKTEFIMRLNGTIAKNKPGTAATFINTAKLDRKKIEIAWS